jgi:hypothetical protein
MAALRSLLESHDHPTEPTSRVERIDLDGVDPRAAQAGPDLAGAGTPA